MSKRSFHTTSIDEVQNKISRSSTDNIFQPTLLQPTRMRYLTSTEEIPRILEGCVVVWMSRDQRVHDNYSLLCGLDIAKQYNVPLKVRLMYSIHF